MIYGLNPKNYTKYTNYIMQKNYFLSIGKKKQKFKYFKLQKFKSFKLQKFTRRKKI